MKVLTRFQWFLWKFGRFQIPLIGYLRPKLIHLSDSELVACIPLRRRSKNHLGSMYFGALSVGADLSGGFHGFYHADKAGKKVSLAFKSFRAQFLKRPESDVYFVSSMGNEVANMIETSSQTGERINQMIRVDAYTDYPANKEKVAEFDLELSIKVVK